ncbi:polyprotein [Gossypium australe]|uniref:Polyprotein n=1 Tax=Gossypium australe TaxID=47621 RepID=A0A5B6X017_9ROSI|nr:polyprotein [Gossypium australe]
MNTVIKQWVRECFVCQLNKYDTSAHLRLLQPLPVPTLTWFRVSMDFIEGLPPSKGKNSILVIVDTLTKYDHLVGVSHPFTAITVAQAYLNHVYKLHGLLDTIISN